MNAALAAIYRTGQIKTASENDELDLSQISAADYLQLIASHEEGEKVATDDDFDMSQLSGRELLELYAAAEEAEGNELEEEAIEKMASDGSLDYYDMAGRIMAHSYANELNKVASDEDGLPDNIEVDLDAISGEELNELLEAGYEFDGGEEKTAAFTGPLQRTKKGKLTARQKSEFRAQMKSQQAGPDRGAEAAKTWRDADRAGSHTRTGRGRMIEAGMKGRHYGGIAKKHVMSNKGRYGAAGAAVGAAATFAAMKRRKKNRS